MSRFLLTGVSIPAHRCLDSCSPVSRFLLTGVSIPAHRCLDSCSPVSRFLLTGVSIPAHRCLDSCSPVSRFLLTGVSIPANQCLDSCSPVNRDKGVQPTVTFPIGDHVIVLHDYKKTGPSKILKLLTCRCHHLIYMLVEFSQSLVLLTHLKCLNVPYP